MNDYDGVVGVHAVKVLDYKKQTPQDNPRGP